MKKQLYDYDPAAALDSKEAIDLFMADALETSDSVYIAKALEVISHARKHKRQRLPKKPFHSAPM